MLDDRLYILISSFFLDFYVVQLQKLRMQIGKRVQVAFCGLKCLTLDRSTLYKSVEKSKNFTNFSIIVTVLVRLVEVLETR